MDYTFKRDLYGQYLAEFSMGHEAFGHWLTEELGSNQTKIGELLIKLEQLSQRSAHEHSVPGREFTLEMDQSGIEVRAALFDDANNEISTAAPEELNHYDQESHACCGLDDFRQLLQAWQIFTKG